MAALVFILAAVLAGAVAAVSGFGIGSILTPLVALDVGMKLAVAAVAIPHFVATALRFWMLRAQVDRKILFSFGLMSAAGGLGGALLHAWAESVVLSWVLGILLVFAGLGHLTGFLARMRFHGSVAWMAGAVSGALGGLVGNQGGLRAAAMLGFEIRRESFVATATAIGLIVDAARMPVYFAGQHRELLAVWPAIALATAGVVAGTLLGVRGLRGIPEARYRPVVAVLILALGVFVLYRLT